MLAHISWAGPAGPDWVMLLRTLGLPGLALRSALSVHPGAQAAGALETPGEAPLLAMAEMPRRNTLQSLLESCLLTPMGQN